MSTDYQVIGENEKAAFTLKVHRGEGMCLLAMNWRKGRPPNDFVGFAIEYMEPGGDRYLQLRNRLNFAGDDGDVDRNELASRFAPFQKFRWVHFPRNADKEGEFTYRVMPVFMNPRGELSYGEAQVASLRLASETYPGKLNVTFTRGFVSSQAFVENYQRFGDINTLLPPRADDGLDFKPTHPKTKEALAWMGFEARRVILDLLDRAIADEKAAVQVVAYDLSELEVVNRLKKLGKRLQIIIDDDGAHGKPGSGETKAAAILTAAGAQVLRQHMGGLQHNKVIIVDGPKQKQVVCGSTNFSWRGLYVQANNAIVLTGAKPVKLFQATFAAYWDSNNSVAAFGATPSAVWTSLGLTGVDAEVTNSPHIAANAALADIAADVAKTKSSLLFSMAFLYQTPGAMRDAFAAKHLDDKIFVYGISDKAVGGLDFQRPGGNKAVVAPSALTDAPKPFSDEPTGGGGTRMHHKFIVIDFDKPTARVYMGSYNFSIAADTKNGENLLVIRDRRIATAYMVEAIRIFDHYHFRMVRAKANEKGGKLALKKPPKPGAKPWFEEDFTVPAKIKDRLLFS